MSDPKTPREWLLARHRQATPSLDALRRDAIASLATPNLTWRELLAACVRPRARGWRMLAAAWLVVALLHFARDRQPASPLLPPPSPEAFALWLGQLKSHETLAQINHRP